MRNLIDQTVKGFGRLDVAVNNAGTEGHPGPVIEQAPESYAAVFDTNVLGTLLGMKHEMRVMAAQGGGGIINLSSVLGKVGAPGAAVYTASKHAVEGLTKAAALEGARAACASTRCRRGRSRPRCTIALPVGVRARQTSSTPCRSSERRHLRKLPTP